MIITHNKEIDSFFKKGGTGLAVFYGEGGSGKSCFVLMNVLEKLKEKKRVLFFDTENSFSLERFQQISDNNYKKYMDNLILIKISNFSKQHKQLTSIDEKLLKDVSLIVVDSMNNYFRRLFGKKQDLSKGMLGKQLRCLRLISKKIPVIVTSQVYTDFKKKDIRMFGDDIFKKFCDVKVKLDKGLRKKIFILEKPIKKEVLFDIVNTGVKYYEETES
ncbi:hypothetical protein CL617_04950 [archaeon]|nr:hypothetical protein [archaeon]